MATYNKNVWHTGDVITEEKMNNLENGIETIVTSVNIANTSIADVGDGVTALSETVNSIQTDVSTISEQVNNIRLEDITEALNTAAGNIATNNELIVANQSSITSILTRLGLVEHILDMISEHSDTSVITALPEDESTFVSDKKLILTDVILSDDTNSMWNLKGKAVILNNSNAENVTIRATADEEVVFTDNTINGTLPKSVSNAMLSINTDDEVVIKGCDIGQNGYNCVEIGLNDTAPKKVTIKNCNFTGTLSNNAISIFATADNAVVNIENCNFSSVSNVLRLSNRTNATGVKINFTNCTWDHLEDDPEYKAVVICQDYTSASQAETIEANRFGGNKIEINFNNCTGEDGNIITLPEDSSWAGTGEGRLIYVFANKWDNEERGKVPYADYFEMFPDIGVNNSL